MTTLATILLIVGLVFPVLSLLTGILSIVIHWRYRKHTSPVFIPLVGPILLTGWVLLGQKPPWFIPLVWIMDIGTVAFLAVSPRLFVDWWRVSLFTRTLTLRGAYENQNAVITLHSTGHYLLRKSWDRVAGETGIAGLGEPGVFTHRDDGYDLIAHHGLHRLLRQTDEGLYRVEDDPQEEGSDTHSHNGWMLTA